ncbi:MAG: hypothetical protein MI862_00435 [Desulfobacterales bacterium]|nr:hypothetical protein [Desulfobacterales bacterium]
MGRLADEMIWLKKEVDRLKANRQSFNRQLKEDRTRLTSIVNELTGRFGTERKNRHARVREELSSFRAGLTGFVDKLEQDRSRMTDRFHREMDTIRREQADRNADVGNIRESVADFLNASRQKRLEFSGRLRQDLVSSRQQIIGQVKEELSRGKSERYAAVDDLKREVNAMVSSFRKTLQETSRQNQENRIAYISGIRESVSQLMQEMNTFRSELINDLNTMRRVWQNEETGATRSSPEPDYFDDIRDRTEAPAEYKFEFDPEPDQSDQSGFTPDSSLTDDDYEPAVPAGEDVSEPAPVSESESDVEPDSAEKMDGDDLSLISGIGPERHKQLNAAGIHTFSQLAESDPDTLYTILNKQVGKAFIILWIDQAKELIF